VRHEVGAELPSSVSAHVAVVGQSVRAGTVLLVLECMKTEVPVESPVDGAVTWLRPCAAVVGVGDVVAVVEGP